jgi:hypothetical protein
MGSPAQVPLACQAGMEVEKVLPSTCQHLSQPLDRAPHGGSGLIGPLGSGEWMEQQPGKV